MRLLPASSLRSPAVAAHMTRRVWMVRAGVAHAARHARRQIPLAGFPRVGTRPHTEAARASAHALRGRVWTLALPAIGEQLLVLGVGTSDTFLSGHLSAAAMARLG